MNTQAMTQARPIRLGEFLISEGRITADQLLAGLVLQARERHTELEVLHRQVGLSAETCLALGDAAGAAGVSLFDQAIAEGAIPDWTIDRLRRTQAATQPPLGRALVQLGIATQTEVRAWLFSFMGQAEPPPLSTRLVRAAPAAPVLVQEPQVQDQQVQASPAQPVAETAAPAEPAHAVSLPPTAPLDVESAVLDDYREFLTDDLRSRLDARILALRDREGDDLAAELDGLYRDLHSIKGSANFLGASATVATVHLMEDCLGLVKRRPELLDETTRQELIDGFFTGLDLVWELRAAVLNDHDEGPLLATLADRHLDFQRRILAAADRLADQVAATTSSSPLADLF